MTDDSIDVGDMTLTNNSGVVVVHRDGEHIGAITAQGLHEAADMGDDALQTAWKLWKMGEEDA